jgi:hypothetical protein
VATLCDHPVFTPHRPFGTVLVSLRADALQR